jgi:hypothetical protein
MDILSMIRTLGSQKLYLVLLSDGQGLSDGGRTGGCPYVVRRSGRRLRGRHRTRREGTARVVYSQKRRGFAIKHIDSPPVNKCRESTNPCYTPHRESLSRMTPRVTGNCFYGRKSTNKNANTRNSVLGLFRIKCLIPQR